MRGPMTVSHTSLIPNMPTVSPALMVTELFFLYFPDSIARNAHVDQIHRLAVLEETCEKDIRAVRQVAGGWAVEDVKRDGEHMKLFVSLLDWESIEARASALERFEAQQIIARFSEHAVGLERCLIPFWR